MNRRRVDIPPLNPSLMRSTQFSNSLGDEGGSKVPQWNSPYPQTPTESPNFIPGGSSLSSVPQPSQVFSFDSLMPLSSSSSTFRGSPSALVADHDSRDSSVFPPIPFTISNPLRVSGSTLPMNPSSSTFQGSPSASVANQDGRDSSVFPPIPFTMSNPLRAFSSTPRFRGSPSAPVADQDGRDSALPPIPFTKSKSLRASNSDIPFGLEAMIPQNLQQITNPDPFELLGGREVKDEPESLEDFMAANVDLDNISENVDHMFRNISDSESESSANEVGLGSVRGIGPSGRHLRSVSMDSCFKLPPLPGQVSSTNLVDGNENALNITLGNGMFTASEIKQVMADNKLRELAVSDPKRVKRVLTNRKSAARSKQKKTRYLHDMEHKLHTLKAEASAMSAKFNNLQRDNMVLTNKNKELKFRLETMEKQARLRDAMNEQLSGEVERLKLATGQLSELNEKMYQQLNISQMHEPERNPHFG